MNWALWKSTKIFFTENKSMATLIFCNLSVLPCVIACPLHLLLGINLLMNTKCYGGSTENYVCRSFAAFYDQGLTTRFLWDYTAKLMQFIMWTPWTDTLVKMEVCTCTFLLTFHFPCNSVNHVHNSTKLIKLSIHWPHVLLPLSHLFEIPLRC